MSGKRIRQWAGVVGPVLFAGGWLLAGRMVDGYSHVVQAGSELGADGSEAFWVMNPTFVLSGALIALFSIDLRDLRRGGTVFALVLVVGLAMIGTGFANCSTGCPFPGEDPGATVEDGLHMAMGALVFLSCAAAPLVAASGVRDIPALAGYRRYSRVTGWLTAVAVVAFVPAEALGVEGAVQRVMLALPFAWFAVTAIMLLRGSLPHGHQHAAHPAAAAA